MNVVPLFSSVAVNFEGPLTELDALVDECEETTVNVAVNRLVASPNQFPDQSMYILDEQIKGLKERLDRLKFYLSDLDDLLPT